MHSADQRTQDSLHSNHSGDVLSTLLAIYAISGQISLACCGPGRLLMLLTPTVACAQGEQAGPRGAALGPPIMSGMGAAVVSGMPDQLRDRKGVPLWPTPLATHHRCRGSSCRNIVTTLVKRHFRITLLYEWPDGSCASFG